MKKVLFIKGLLLSGILFFTGCDKDDNIQPDDVVMKTFESMYPNAKNVEWENKSGYKVAEFYLDFKEMEAWFDTKGNWIMTETDITFLELPETVQNGFKNSSYAEWNIDDMDTLEKPDGMFYLFDLKSGKKEIKLLFDEKGNIIS